MAVTKQTKAIDQTDRNSGNQTVLATLARTAFGAGATNTVWTPTSGKRINLRYLSVTAAGATVITVKLNNLLVVEFDMTANWPIAEFIPPDDMVPEATAADDLLTITSSAAVTVGATALGFEA